MAPALEQHVIAPRYVARTYAATTLLALTGLVVLVVSTSVIETAERLARRDEGGVLGLKLAVYGAAEYAYQVLPIACFLGAIVAGTLLARRGELLALQAAGLSPTRLARTLLGVTLLFALGGGAFGEWLVPRAVAEVNHILRTLRKTDALTQLYDRPVSWVRRGEWLLHLPDSDADTGWFHAPILYRLHDGRIAQVYEGAALTHDGGGWRLTAASVFNVDSGLTERAETLSLDLPIRPQELMDLAGHPRQMSTAQVLALIGRREAAGLDATAHRMELHNRYAYPLTAVWLFLLAAPWVLHPDRRRSLALALGLGVVAIAVVLAITNVFQILALGHKVGAPLGAWGPSLAFALLLPLNQGAYGRYRTRGSLF